MRVYGRKYVQWLEKSGPIFPTIGKLKCPTIPRPGIFNPSFIVKGSGFEDEDEKEKEKGKGKGNENEAGGDDT